jgi:hypothetical protein
MSDTTGQGGSVEPPLVSNKDALKQNAVIY